MSNENEDTTTGEIEEAMLPGPVTSEEAMNAGPVTAEEAKQRIAGPSPFELDQDDEEAELTGEDYYSGY